MDLEKEESFKKDVGATTASQRSSSRTLPSQRNPMCHLSLTNQSEVCERTRTRSEERNSGELNPERLIRGFGSYGTTGGASVGRRMMTGEILGLQKTRIVTSIQSGELRRGKNLVLGIDLRLVV